MNELLHNPDLHKGIESAITLAALVTARIAPIVQLVPFLGGKALPQQVKMGISIAITILIFPIIWSTGAADTLPQSSFAITMLILKELLLGVMFGFVTALVFDAVRIAGQLIDNARGQTMATVLAPQIPERVSVSADILYQLSIVTFLAIGGHRLFIAALVQSYKALPPQVMPNFGDHALAITDGVVRLGADAITLGVLLAFPVTAAILLTELCLAMVNRAAPQINVFFLGMPLKATLGLGVLLLSLHTIIDRVMFEATSSIHYLDALMKSLGAGT